MISARMRRIYHREIRKKNPLVTLNAVKDLLMNCALRIIISLLTPTSLRWSTLSAAQRGRGDRLLPSFRLRREARARSVAG
jgi:hypothetical protein